MTSQTWTDNCRNLLHKRPQTRKSNEKVCLRGSAKKNSKFSSLIWERMECTWTDHRNAVGKIVAKGPRGGRVNFFKAVAKKHNPSGFLKSTLVQKEKTSWPRKIKKWKEEQENLSNGKKLQTTRLIPRQEEEQLVKTWILDLINQI